MQKEKERPYPRPISNCSGCEGEIVLCWGEKIKTPYWRHKSKEDCHFEHLNESENHKLAKKMLKEFLLRKGEISLSYSQECRICRKRPKLELDIEYDDVVCEKRCDKHIWDVACVSADSSVVVFGIEIMVTHKADSYHRNNSETRWIEVNADQVIDLLDDRNIKRIDLDCIRSDFACVNCKIGIERKQQEFENRRIERERLEKAEMLAVIGDRTNRDIAIETGFLMLIEDRNKRDYERVMEEYAFGSYTIGRYAWGLRCGDYRRAKYFERAVEYNKKCLRCEKEHPVTMFKPLCRDCYAEVNSDDYEFEETEYKLCQTPESRRKALRNIIGPMLDKIPFSHTCGPCVQCKRDYFEISPDEYTQEELDYVVDGNGISGCIRVWNHDKKRKDKKMLCELCFTKFLIKHHAI